MDQQTGSGTAAAWGSVFAGASKAQIEALLPAFLRGRRWFSAKARTIRQTRITGAVPIADGAAPPQAYLSFIEVEYAEGDKQTFVLPLALAAGAQALAVEQTMPAAFVTRLDTPGDQQRILYDATWSPQFPPALLDAIRENRRFGDAAAEIRAWPTPVFDSLAGAAGRSLPARIMGAEQSNTSIVYGDALILKLFRRLEQGVSPDLEIGGFLTAQGFPHIPPLAGAIELVEPEREPRTLAILQGFAANQGDAWSYTLGEVDAYFARAAAAGTAPERPRGEHPLEMADEPVPPAMRAVLGAYLDSARLLGRRTAELHLALASDPANPAFAPEPISQAHQRALYDAVHKLTDDAFRLLAGRLNALPPATRAEAEAVISRRSAIESGFAPLLDRAITAQRTRVHGDYHLGQILYTGDDFVIIDFEGEPLRPLAERRQKHSPLKDVAGMLRSFHYAAYAALFSRTAGDDGAGGAFDGAAWSDAWHQWISAAFLAEYLQVAAPGAFLPRAAADLRVLLDAYLLEKAIYELIYELNNRPDWVRIPLQGISQLAR